MTPTRGSSQAGRGPLSAEAGSCSAREAYDSLAPFYDEFTAGYPHEQWLEELEGLALQHGLPGRTVLDVACGTGKSALPLATRGYEVSACDISPAMVQQARRRLGGRARRVFAADMRRLPACGRFDLITCLDDALNYLLEPADLHAALASMRRALRPGGLLVFDVNSLSTYRATFAMRFEREGRGRSYRWRGEQSGAARPGALYEAVIEVLPDAGTAVSSRHRQRHWPRDWLAAALGRAGLECVAVLGQRTGGHVGFEADEELHPKLVFLARNPRTNRRREEGPHGRREPVAIAA
ncbi:MAG TPA: class I SAM-dependent methyltransferase [Thermoleophilaceae bacterium]|jgi:SAM-dependent methyltransferase